MVVPQYDAAVSGCDLQRPRRGGCIRQMSEARRRRTAGKIEPASLQRSNVIGAL